jgi:hypothetical protein
LVFVNTRDKTVEWEGHAISLKERGELQNHEALNYIYHTVNAPSVIMEAEERQSRILDANYEAVNVKEYVNEIKHLSDEEKSALTKVLQRHPKLLGGGLGILNMSSNPSDWKSRVVQSHTMQNHSRYLNQNT